MVHKCCVSECQSNYNCKDSTECVTVFSFPKDKDVVKEWIERIPRENLIVTKHTRVCIQHFEDKDICRYDVFPVADGGSPIKVSILFKMQLRFVYFYSYLGKYITSEVSI